MATNSSSEAAATRLSSRCLWRVALTALTLPALALPTYAGKADFEQTAAAKVDRKAGFKQFVADMWPKAKRNGVSRRTFNEAFRGVTPDPRVIRLLNKQPEFTIPIWKYVERGINEIRVQNGRKKLKEVKTDLSRIEKRFGVNREVIVSIWGLESNFGQNKGSMYVIRSLATLGAQGRRKDFGRSQLLAALKILEAGDIDRKGMLGSWAGAMGHTQFIPTTYLSMAVDWTGDGKRDIWNSRQDALASTANYLSKSGWRMDRPWGWAIRLPERFNRHLIGREHARPVAEWAKMGIRPRNSQRFGNRTAKSWVIMPAGQRGPAFLVTQNFDAVYAYNHSVSYVMAVTHLADRIKGRTAVLGKWPTDERPLKRSEKREVQKHLADRGLYKGSITGFFHGKTLAAILAYQKSIGVPQDGYVTPALLRRMRQGK